VRTVQKSELRAVLGVVSSLDGTLRPASTSTHASNAGSGNGQVREAVGRNPGRRQKGSGGGGGGDDEDALAKEERSIVLAAALKEHDTSVTNLWVGEGAIGISFSSFSAMNMPKGVVPRGGSIVVTDVDTEGPAAAFGIMAGDLIVTINGDSLAPGTTKDAFLEVLVSTPRPVCIGFRLQR